MSFLDTVRLTIKKHAMLRPGDRLLVAVSGGPDSLALLVALVALRGELKLRLEAATVDHGLRPGQVRREISLVRKMGELFGVPVHILRRHVKRHSGESLEAKARSIRYEALTQCARKRKISILAVGHTQDDQAETVLLWLLRGTGIAGLAGIPPVREAERLRIIRPLLWVSRREIEAFLRDHRLRAREDSSNRSIKFTRNRIRRDLIPLLERQYNPKLRQHLGQLAEILRDDFDYLKSQWQKAFREAARMGTRGIRLDRKKLSRYPASARRGILRLGVARLQGDLTGFTQSHWSSLERMLTNGLPARQAGSASALDLPHRFRAERQGERWILLSRSGPTTSFQPRRRRGSLS